MPVPLRHTLRRASVAAATGLLLVLLLPQAALAASPAIDASAGPVTAVGIAVALLIAAALSVYAQVQRERMHEHATARRLARHRQVVAARRRRMTRHARIRRSARAFRRTAVR